MNKKNMIYLATGLVFAIFAVCIAYVFTEPSQTPQKQEAALEEQDASQLTAQNTEQKTPSADALVFTAQENAQAITTPPAEQEETKNTENTTANLPTAQNTQAAANVVNTVNKAENTAQEQAAVIEDKGAASVQEKKISEPKPALQDKLPVPFVADSLKTRTGLVFEGDKPIKPKTFRLNNPDRVVVDIDGYWVLKLPQLISNRMVKDIRSNAQKDKTRIVFDLKLPVSSSLLYRIHSRKYQLVFK